jgi:hypothetical protein
VLQQARQADPLSLDGKGCTCLPYCLLDIACAYLLHLIACMCLHDYDTACMLKSCLCCHCADLVACMKQTCAEIGTPQRTCC